jgi:hypothetical protein
MLKHFNDQEIISEIDALFFEEAEAEAEEEESVRLVEAAVESV